jgi:5-(carboxyamino)imidazole ribonucleotide mutase
LNIKSKKIAIIMGSSSDLPTMENTKDILNDFNIKYDVKIVSAHRTPELMYKFAQDAHKEYSIIIAAAGGAAHLPGMMASLTTLPVIGVPIKSSQLSGVDSFLSIVQMPGGIPVPTMAIGNAGATNAALFALRILAINDINLKDKLSKYNDALKIKVEEMQKSIKK